MLNLILALKNDSHYKQSEKINNELLQKTAAYRMKIRQCK